MQREKNESNEKVDIVKVISLLPLHCKVETTPIEKNQRGEP